MLQKVQLKKQMIKIKMIIFLQVKKMRIQVKKVVQSQLNPLNNNLFKMYLNLIPIPMIILVNSNLYKL